MILAAFVTTWWAGFGLVVGINRAHWLPGPQDRLSVAAWWAFAWSILWIVEAFYGE